MIRRTYSGEADVRLLQDFNAAAIAATDHCGYLHPGDIPHHLFNGNKYYDPTEILTIWEDNQGVAAWLLVGPSHKSYDAQVRPDLRGNDLERELLEYADDRTIELMRRYDIDGDCIYANAFRGDTSRVELLLALGWEADDTLPYVLNRTEINSVDAPTLLDGYSFQSAKGVEDAAALADVHNAAFSAGWTPELYRKVMESPGYASLHFSNSSNNLPRKGRDMSETVDSAFREWTEGKDPPGARISLFEHVRDIPYAVIPNIRNYESGPGELLRGMRGSCTPKHFLLGVLFERLGLGIRYATFPFSWNDPDIRYPDELRELAAALPTEYHLALKVLIDGRWRLVDATWDPPLKEAGFPVNDSWDGMSDTLLAVRPIEEIENRDANDRDACVRARKAGWTDDDHAREKLFVEKLNRWLESLRTRGG